MDSSWAIRALKNGETVRRAMWLDVPSDILTWVSVRLESEEGRFPDLVATLDDGRRCYFVMTAHHLLAEDWELA
jgi:hypothetical protein